MADKLYKCDSTQNGKLIIVPKSKEHTNLAQKHPLVPLVLHN